MQKRKLGSYGLEVSAQSSRYRGARLPESVLKMTGL